MAYSIWYMSNNKTFHMKKTKNNKDLQKPFKGWTSVLYCDCTERHKEALIIFVLQYISSNDALKNHLCLGTY